MPLGSRESHPPSSRRPRASTLDDAQTIVYATTSRRSPFSLVNLFALASDKKAIRDAVRQLFWQDCDGVVPIDNLKQCSLHAVLGGARAGALAYGLRSGLSVLQLLLRIIRSKNLPKLATLFRLGQDSLRFAAMIGSFTAIYKFLLNSLPLALPPKPTDPWKLVLSDLEFAVDTPEALPSPVDSNYNTPRAHPVTELGVELLIRKKGLRSHAFTAGAIAGAIAVMFEQRGNRLWYAQLLFVHGLHGTWGHWSEKTGFRVPHGDVLVFAMCCGQIIYNFFMRPEANNPNDNKWIQSTLKMIPESVKTNMVLAHTRQLNAHNAKGLLSHSSPIPTECNRALLIDTLSTGHATPSRLPGYDACAVIHPWLDSCAGVQVERFIDVFTCAIPICGVLHAASAVIFKRSTLSKEPGPILGQTLLDAIRSSAFLSSFATIVQGSVCAKINACEYLSSLSTQTVSSAWIRRLLLSRFSFWGVGAVAATALLVEEPRYRSDFAICMLIKGLGSVWNTGLDTNVGRHSSAGEMMLMALGTGMFMSSYQNSPNHLRGYARLIVYQMTGPN